MFTGRKLTNEEFIKRVKEIAPTIEPLDKYVRMDVSIGFKCKICGSEFRNSPNNILGSRKQGCPNCYHNKQKTTEEDFINKAKECNHNITVIGEYTGIKNKIEVECVYCKKHITMRADSILEGRGHNSCIQKNLERKPLKTQEEFIEQLKNVNDNIIPLGTYTKFSDKMEFNCLVCGNSWKAKISHVILGESGCPHCKISKGEQKVENYLKNNNIKYIKQYTFNDCRDKLPLPFDFYLPCFNICIEYDGEQHVRPAFGEKSFLKTIAHDEIKNNYCKSNNIKLIRIPHTDFNNVEIILDKFIS